jgi:hypothetical protein
VISDKKNAVWLFSYHLLLITHHFFLPTIMPSGGINKCRGPKASNRGALAA